MVQSKAEEEKPAEESPAVTEDTKKVEEEAPKEAAEPES